MAEENKLIELNKISKDYKISKRSRGFIGTMGNLSFPKYEIKEAVKDMSFTINEGEMVGFIGPNGAGKSTTIKMLSGILHPTSGEIKVNGIIPHMERRKHVKEIGVMFGQKSQLWWDLPVIESYEMFKYIYKIPDKTYKKNLEVVNKILGVNEYFDQPVRQLSLGQRVKADIGATLLHSPKILFLDEPTIGLDVVAKENIRQFLIQINKETNITMLFTTHDMKDIESTCNRMIIIDKGLKIYDGTVKDIKNKYGLERELEVTFNENIKDIHISNIDIVSENQNTKTFRFLKEKVKVQNLINELSSKYEILDLTIIEPDIDKIIRGIYEMGFA